MGSNEGCEVYGLGVINRQNNKATVPPPPKARTQAFVVVVVVGGSNLPIRLLLKCHMGAMCAGQWPLGLSTNRAGWEDR